MPLAQLKQQLPDPKMPLLVLAVIGLSGPPRRREYRPRGLRSYWPATSVVTDPVRHERARLKAGGREKSSSLPQTRLLSAWALLLTRGLFCPARFIRCRAGIVFLRDLPPISAVAPRIKRCRGHRELCREGGCVARSCQAAVTLGEKALQYERQVNDPESQAHNTVALNRFQTLTHSESKSSPNINSIK